MTVEPAAQQVLDFWFGPPTAETYGQQRPEWFRKDAAFDAAIASRFGELIELALAGGLAAWRSHPSSALAEILVLDQFTRNSFRDSARSFAGDDLALRQARALVESGQDIALLPVQRSFAYLPFEHAEDLDDQREALRLFAQLGRDEPKLAGLLQWAQRHHDVVARFGRFPHRNAVLGRTSTAEEAEFLKQPGSGF